MDKSKNGLGLDFFQDPRLSTDEKHIRAQSGIRADGSPSAQIRAPQRQWLKR
jgi:hypothetical protein